MYGLKQYGNTLYSEESQNEHETEAYKPDLMQYLPPFYHDFSTMQELQDTAAIEMGYLKFNVEDFLNQIFLDTATWGLSFREKELGIETDLSKTYEFRREILKAKLLGTGTTTRKMIKSIAETFSGAEVEVIEYPSEYRFEIKFIGMKGIPPNMAGLMNAIEEIKPAHLEHIFTYSYSWWETMRKLTWGQAKTKTWYDLKTYE